MRLLAPALAAAALAAAAAGAGAACSPASSPADVVPETRDVKVQADASVAGGGYAYVARRPHGAVALAGSHALTKDEVTAIVDRIADDFEACARGRDAGGALGSGAAHVVAMAGPTGAVAIADLRVSSGENVAATALMCLVAPMRATVLPPPGDAGAPAVAVDATWGPAGSSPRPAAPP